MAVQHHRILRGKFIQNLFVLECSELGDAPASSQHPFSGGSFVRSIFENAENVGLGLAWIQIDPLYRSRIIKEMQVRIDESRDHGFPMQIDDFRALASYFG